MENQTRYILYLRKSTDDEDRQVLSIVSQKDEMLQIAKRFELNITLVLEEAKSAKSPGREIFNDMLTRIQRGEADGILCWHVNRLARNPIDGGQIIWFLQNGIIIAGINMSGINADGKQSYRTEEYYKGKFIKNCLLNI